MPELLHPGVYTLEVSSGVRPIEGVSTSTAAFIGVADKGPIPGTILPTGRAAQPVMVTSLTDYTRQFGGFRRDSFLTYAVRSFYENGGRRLYIVRVASGASLARVPVFSPPLSPPSSTLPIVAANEGAWGNDIWIATDDSSDGDTTNNFKLLVMFGKTVEEARANIVETYDNVTFRSATPADPIPANYVRTLVNSRSEYIAFQVSPGPPVEVTSRPTNTPRDPSGRLLPTRLAGGGDGTINTVDFVGAAATDSTRTGTGIHALDKITDVNLIAIPGRGDAATINAGMAYCKNQRALQDCFFIADVGFIDDVNGARIDGAQPQGVITVSDARTFALPVAATPLDKAAGDYGAIYYPWVRAADPIGSGRNPLILLPPSGFVTGIYARIDNSRGVFKAPAGTEAGVSGALTVATTVSDTEQDQLNPIMVNVIRTVPTSGIVVWGARTIGSNTEWRYIPVRRMAIFLRVSIYYGIQWAVFEPNDEPLWASLRLNIRAFMLTQFRAGAFQGSKPDDAFFVKCDSTTTTQQDIDNGVVNILVGFAPLKPAEFVVLKLSQKVNQPIA
ncbi:MAG TPA: phage tail sheath subtilisin-like domain-containing protein, partial [Pyrinomonadaceae bacterium]|nr:phage tail sheath subtilisin-like domain-containing protein [Pyrinomonadaceae bacterium]